MLDRLPPGVLSLAVVSIVIIIAVLNSVFSTGDDLVTAVIANDIQEIDRLLIEGANVESVATENADRKEYSGLTVLHIAAKNNLPDVVSLLIKQGVDLNKHDGLHGPPLHTAASNNSVEAATVMIAGGAKVNLIGSRSYTSALHQAVNAKALDMIKMLIENGADINIKGGGTTPLMLSISKGYSDVTELLQDYGAEMQDGLSRKRYADRNLFFTIVPPANWRIEKYPEEKRGKAAFIATEKQVELRVLAAVVDFDSIEGLISGAKNIEKNIGMDTHITEVSFYGRPAIKRSFESNGVRLLVYDFLLGNVHHNIQFGAPSSVFSKHHSLAVRSMETYDPLLRTVDEKEALEHALAGKRRLAELSIEMGRMDMASDYINDGLELSPSDPALKALEAKLESGIK